MRVFLDENIPRQLGRLLSGHQVSSVELEGWKGKQNGELLALVEPRLEVIITADANLSFQQNMFGRNLSLIVLPTNKLTMLTTNAEALSTTLADLADLDHCAIVVIEWSGRRTIQRIDTAPESPRQLQSVRPYGT